MGVVGASTAALAGLAGCSPDSPASAENQSEIKWDDEADVVIVGGGGTGYAAAVEALEAGSSVIVLEKSAIAGGNTVLCAGMMLAYYPPLAKELSGWFEGEDTLELFTEEMLSWGAGLVDDDKVIEMCEASSEHIQWMMDLGRTYDTCDIIAPIHGFDTDSTWAPRSFHNIEASTGHFDLLHDNAMSFENIAELTKTEAKRLITNESGEVIGVEAEKQGSPCFYRANKGVLIATAGPDFGEDLTKTYNRQMYWGSKLAEQGFDFDKARGSMANTGDGIRMGLEIGAGVKMSPACVMSDCWRFGQVGTYGRPYDTENLYHNPPRPGAIYVNSKGNRFVQEDAQWGFICSEIYNSVERSGAGVAEGAPNVFAVTDAEHLNNFSDMGVGVDVEAEVAAGTLFRGDTLEELAQQIGIENPIALKETVEIFNGFCEEGEDRDFYRKSDLVAFSGAPYYAVRSKPIVMGAAGGLSIDNEARVLDVSGKPIPRLYAGGMASGGWIGPFYNACGWAILGTVHWGRKAGKNIAALEAWG